MILFKKPPIHISVDGWLMLGAIVLYLSFSLPTLLSYPTPQSDEAMFASTAYNLAKHGSFGVPIYPDFNGSSRDFIFVGRFYAVGLASWFRFFGASLFSSRLFATMGAILTAVLVWLTARKLVPSRVAFIAGALCLFAWKSFNAGHSVRPDIWVALGGAFILWFYVSLPTEPGLLGLCAGLLPNIHLPAGFFIVSLSLVMLVDWFTKRNTTTALIRYSLGLTLGLACWLILLLGLDPQQTLATYRGGILGAPSGTLNFEHYSLIFGLQNAWQFIKSGFLGASRFGWLEFLILTAASFSLPFLKPNPIERNFLVFALGLCVCFVLTPYLPTYYVVMTVPITTLLFVLAANHLVQGLGPKMGLVILMPLLLLYIAGDLAISWNSRAISYARYDEALHQLVPTSASVLGDGRFWFEFRDQPFTTMYYVHFAPQAETMPPDDWIKSVLTARQIEYVLWSNLVDFWSASNGAGPDTFHQYLIDHCLRVGVVTDIFNSVDRGELVPQPVEVWHCS